MELIRELHNLRPRHRGCVATIGNFDGVHRGHARLVDRTRERAEELGLPACVVTFEPHSKEFFAPDKAPPRLTDLRGKVTALRTHGVDQLLVLHFNRDLAALSPREFIDRVGLPIEKAAKLASALSDPEGADAVLATGFLTEDNLAEFSSLSEEFQETVSKLARLLLLIRLGYPEGDESATLVAMKALQRVSESLEGLAQPVPGDLGSSWGSA